MNNNTQINTTCKKNKYTSLNLKTINSELDYVDETLIKKYKSNEEYIKFLNDILTSSMTNFDTIIKNLDTKYK